MSAIRPIPRSIVLKHHQNRTYKYVWGNVLAILNTQYFDWSTDPPLEQMFRDQSLQNVSKMVYRISVPNKLRASAKRGMVLDAPYEAGPLYPRRMRRDFSKCNKFHCTRAKPMPCFNYSRGNSCLVGTTRTPSKTYRSLCTDFKGRLRICLLDCITTDSSTRLLALQLHHRANEGDQYGCVDVC